MYVYTYVRTVYTYYDVVVATKKKYIYIRYRIYITQYGSTVYIGIASIIAILNLSSKDIKVENM